MRKNFMRDQKGFAGSDALIAVLIIALFTGLIATISYNIYLANSSIKRMSKATSYIVDMFEYIDKTYYDDVEIGKIKDTYNYLNEHTDIEEPLDDNMQRLGILKGTVDNSYEVTLILDGYDKKDEDTLDLVKQVKMRVKYKLGNKEQIIEMKTVKKRENIETPNSPDISLIKLQEGEKIYPLKNTENGWVVCDSNDTMWYNYQNGNWAIVLKTNVEKAIDEKVDVAETEEIYAWIPRYAYNDDEEKIEFLYSNTDKIIENSQGYNQLKKFDKTTYQIPEEFLEETKGIWTADNTLNVYEILNKVYPLNS